jgi:hypothetical protein
MESSGAFYLGGFMITFVPISKFGGGLVTVFHSLLQSGGCRVVLL